MASEAKPHSFIEGSSNGRTLGFDPNYLGSNPSPSAISSENNNMLECLILGDSIAVGIQQQRPECKSYAQVGINSRAYNKKFNTRKLDADTVVISLGSNDYDGINTVEELTKLRKKIKAKKVFWILPANNLQMAEHVETVGYIHGDILIRIPYLSKDGVHPSGAGYDRIAELTKYY